jgi:hypothetical protein
MQHQQAYPDPSAGVAPGPALFTPGLEQTQAQAPYYGQDAGYGGPAPAQQPYPQAQPPYGQHMDKMADQFAHMGMGGQKGVSSNLPESSGAFIDITCSTGSTRPIS